MKNENFEWNKEFKSIINTFGIVHNFGFGVLCGPIGEILTKIFDCWTLMEEYYLKIFYYIPDNDVEFVFKTTDEAKIFYLSNKKFYWIIAKKDVFEFDNDLNFEEFNNECKTITINRWLLFAIFGFIFVAIFVLYLYEVVVYVIKCVKNYL
ncbi:hypothetical protein PVAND_001073 [Polypedilum vanderplanki]|uniref:Uncharacterized protein n=1 Tax=Polypedilum vanderplanki TaxID=319348 RepID=A0A9J6BMF9_POLVA|nr:hypothetical protein PVAND_001073 [Polypedilum vanderplanki]